MLQLTGGAIPGAIGSAGWSSAPLGAYIRRMASFAARTALIVAPMVVLGACSVIYPFDLETQALGASTGGTPLALGDDLIYSTGQQLIASRNGYLMMRATTQNGTYTSLDNAANAAEVANGTTAGTTASRTLGILKMPPDSEQFELVYDQRV